MVKDFLFRGKEKLKRWPLSVNMYGPAGAVSSANTDTKQRGKVSAIGTALDRLFDGLISVCGISGGAQAYIEYTSASTGVVTPFIFDMDGTKPSFKMKTKQNIAVPGDFFYMGRVAAISIFAAILHCPAFREGVLDAKHGGLKKEDLVELQSYYSCLKADMAKSDLVVQICDWFYYCIAKNWWLEFEQCTEAEFDVTLKRLQQNGMLEHADGTPEPIIAKLKPKKKRRCEKQPALFTEPLADFFERCKKGEFIIQHEWSDRQKALIVPLDFLDTFIPTETFRLMLLSAWLQVKSVLEKMKAGVPYNEILGKNPINIKVMGKPGTGKTTVIEAVLASLGYPKGIINCKSMMEEDEIEGMNKFIKGTVYNIPTRATELHSVGGAVVLEELNLPDPGILQGALGQALAYPFILKANGYQEIKRHPLTLYFSTMNIGTNGTKPMNEALSSRFAEGYIIEDVKEDEFVGILEGAGYESSACRKVYGIYCRIINYLREYHEELTLSLTLRHCLNALDKLKIGFTAQQAFENTFISQLYSSDPEVAEDVNENVLKALI